MQTKCLDWESLLLHVRNDCFNNNNIPLNKVIVCISGLCFVASYTPSSSSSSAAGVRVEWWKQLNDKIVKNTRLNQVSYRAA